MWNSNKLTENKFRNYSYYYAVSFIVAFTLLLIILLNIPILWCKNVSCMICETVTNLQKTNFVTIRNFKKALVAITWYSWYIVFKCLVARNRGLLRSNVSYEFLSPSPNLSLPLSKRKKEKFFAMQKSMRVLKFLRVHLRVFIRFLIDRALLRALSDRIHFEFLVIGSSSGYSVIDSSHGLSVLFFRHAVVFYQNVLLLYLLKAEVLFCVIFLKRT